MVWPIIRGKSYVGETRKSMKAAPGFSTRTDLHGSPPSRQITMLARQTGHAIPQKAMFGMWEWGVR
jgi:hypothetical protein